MAQCEAGGVGALHMLVALSASYLDSLIRRWRNQPSGTGLPVSQTFRNNARRKAKGKNRSSCHRHQTRTAGCDAVLIGSNSPQVARLRGVVRWLR
jgi:hypothetical protein